MLASLFDLISLSLWYILICRYLKYKEICIDSTLDYFILITGVLIEIHFLEFGDWLCEISLSVTDINSDIELFTARTFG